VIPRCRITTAAAMNVPINNATFRLPANSITAYRPGAFSLNPFIAATDEASEIRKIGTITGRIDATNEGNSDSGLSTIDFKSANRVVPLSRSGIDNRRLSHFISCHVISTGTRPTTNPTTIVNPASIRSASAIASGPGMRYQQRVRHDRSATDRHDIQQIIAPGPVSHRLRQRQQQHEKRVEKYRDRQHIPAQHDRRPARFSPNTARNRRTTLSAAPLSIRHIPMIDASAITTAIFPAVTPNPAVVNSTACTQWLFSGSPGNCPAKPDEHRRQDQRQKRMQPRHRDQQHNHAHRQAPTPQMATSHPTPPRQS
jgi:hypothetical protein